MDIKNSALVFAILHIKQERCFRVKGVWKMSSKKMTKCLFAVYLAALTWVILFKLQISFRHLPHIRNINLIPFCASVITNGTIDFDEIIGNFLVFVPFGIFVGTLSEEKSFLLKTIPAFLTSLVFETLQFIFAIGASDITDVLMNTAGGIAGLCLAAVLSKIWKDQTRKMVNILCLAGAIFLFSFILLILLVNL